MAIDSAVNLYVAGYLLNESWSNNGNTDWVVKKFDPNGIEERSGTTGDEIIDSWFLTEACTMKVCPSYIENTGISKKLE